MRLCYNLLAALCLTGAVLGAELLTSEKVEADINVENLKSTLQDLNKIADENGGNRAAGLPGYKAAADYVVDRLKSKGLDVRVQCFKHIFHVTNDIKLTGPNGEAVLVASLKFNPSTPEGGITAELVDVPEDDKSGSGCLPEHWFSVNATGKIALVKRGNCPIADKVKFAKAHGAQAVILYNQHPGINFPSASLGPKNVGKMLPVGIISLETALEWKSRLSMGKKPITIKLVVDSLVEDRESCNIIVDTKEGDPKSVIMLGAHLDGVQDGPGINDNASGCAALIDVALSIAKYGGFNNTVRFAFWGAEESGLLGSLYYADNLTVPQADNIKFYFNYDMIGSKKPKYRIWADTNADRAGASLLLKYLTDHGKVAAYERFGLSSDYVAFLQLGIPSSGLFTGGGEGHDSCYHNKCDNVDNINWEALLLNTKAAGSVAAQLALSVEGIPPREKPDIIYSMDGPEDF